MADLIGTQGSITWTGSADDLVDANVVFWSGTFSRQRYPTTRPGYTMMRYSYGPIEGSGVLRIVVNSDDATNPIPTGTQATLTLLETSGQSYAFSAALTYLRKIGVDSLRGSQQYAEYGWEANATSTSGVTVT